MGAECSARRHDQTDRLAEVCRKAYNRELAVHGCCLNGLAGPGGAVDCCRQGIGKTAGRQGGRVGYFVEHAGGDGPLLAIQAATYFKGKGSGDRFICLVDLGHGDGAAGLGWIGTLSGGKYRLTGGVDITIDRQRSGLRAQRVGAESGVGNGHGDLLTVGADAGEIDHTLKDGGAFQGRAGLPMDAVYIRREIGRLGTAILDAGLFFTGGDTPSAQQQDYINERSFHKSTFRSYVNNTCVDRRSLP